MTKMNERIFNAAKVLLESGSTQQEAATYLKISTKTMRHINAAETYEEYRNIMYESEKKYKQAAAIRARKKEEEKAAKATVTKIVEHVKEPAPVVQLPAPNQKPISMTIQATHFMETKLDQVIDLLKIMNNKLGAIIDDLYGTGSGKDGAAHG